MDSFSAMVPVERIQIMPGHNARRDVGDVSELAASIAAQGLIQPLTVVELETTPHQRTYGLIAGERRLAAVRQLGLSEVPCTVLRGLDERRRVAAMLVENLQRKDLTAHEEAAGIQRLAAMGLSQREIARQLGRSQGHVSKRLALLALPSVVQEAIDQPRDRDSQGITVNEALELTKLAEHPRRLREAFTQGRSGHYGGIVGTVREQLRELEREQAKADARSRLMSAGVPILKEQDYYSWTGRRERPLLGQGEDYAAIRITVEAHQGEPCHAAAIDRVGKVVYVCRDPGRHADADPKTAAQIVKAKEEQEAQREDNRLRREAGRGRREAIERVLASANTSDLAFAARQLADNWRVDETKLACSLLGLTPVEVQGPYGTYRNFRAALSDYAGGSMGAAIRALLALALACGEASVGGNYVSLTGLSKRHLALLVDAGYEPNDSDRQHLTGKPDAADQEEDDVPSCRLCGCTEDDPCEEGCSWVTDPEGLGELCSACLPRVAGGEAWTQPAGAAVEA